MPAWIDSCTAFPADAVILQSSAAPRFLLLLDDLFRTVRRFTGIALLLPPPTSTSVMTAPSILLLDFLRERRVRLWGVRFAAMGGFLC